MTVSLDLRARRRAWAWFFGCGLLAIIVYRLIPLGPAHDVAYVVIGLTGAVAIGVGLALHRPVSRLPWYLIGIGQLLWVVADAIGVWLVHGLKSTPFPSAADVCYLVAYPVIAVGFYLLMRRRIPRHDLGGLLDSLIVTVGLGLLLWVLLAEPTAMGYRGSWTATAVAIAYPAGDLLLVGLLVRLITTPGGWNSSLRLLGLALVLLIAADTTASALNLLTFDSSSSLRLPLVDVLCGLGSGRSAPVDVRGGPARPRAAGPLQPAAAGGPHSRRAGGARSCSPSSS